MESFPFVPTMPVQRRLTKIYTDTKNIYDFIKEPVRKEDPELSTLHRKLKIQKDRLVSWGLEWSDNSSHSPDIDESITKAGLGELVGSVMSTIKEILAEAEPLWQSSRGADDDAMDFTGDSKQALMMWDKSRFEDLIRDLTMSIDTLYDLSKTRQSNRQVATSKSETSRSVKQALEERPFESSRMSTPQQVDPATIIYPETLKSLSTSSTVNPARQVVFMRRPSDTRRSSTRSQVVPVLLEQASYDPIYSITGIPPPMSRFEKLFAGLSQAYTSRARATTGLLHLIGYFEEAEHSRFCLLFTLPMNFGPVDIEDPFLRVPIIVTLADVLGPAHEPSLEVRYRLASNVANAVFDVHAKGATHGNLLASNVVLFHPQDASSPSFELNQVNMRRSYLASFDLFSENAADNTESMADENGIYRHPLDPRITRYTHLTTESKSLDLYSLAMLLLQIGLWAPLTELFPGAKSIPENPTDILQQLSSRCGSVFTKAVQACWHAPEDELSKKARPDVMHQKVFWRVSKALDACCAIDEVSDSEGSDNEGPPAITSVTRKMSHQSTPLKKSQQDPFPAPGQENIITDWSEKPVLKPTFPSADKIVEWTKNTAAATAASKPKPKLRTYPSIRINQEHLQFWHTALMPHINHVLRGFYRKHPESVEISLESIGDSSTRTKPTILVICTSVNKVRSILRKSLVYDKATYGLKVCRGKVVRSRKQDTKRSMANDEEIQALNTAHQDRPSHGASIGAYVGEKHLPPVSFGGTILVDDKPYGMTVHHMLEDPSDSSDLEDEPTDSVHRSSAIPADVSSLEVPRLTHRTSNSSLSGDELYSYPLSETDTSSFVSDSETYSDVDVEPEELSVEPGEKPGVASDEIAPDDYLVTQPALDDIPSDFYPSDEARDEEHLDSCTLGSVYCSSGIRRRASSTSSRIMHEIDWALFDFLPERLPSIPPTPSVVALAKTNELPGMSVSSIGRTTGHKKGRIQDAMSIVKMAGRCTPSASWTVVGGMGVPGDSGAWVISDTSSSATHHDGSDSKVAGTILAYSSRKTCAYICPMDIAITDIAESTGATTISLPGGGTIYDVLASPTSTPTRSRSWQQVEAAVAEEASESISRLEEDIRRGMQLDEMTFYDQLEAEDHHYFQHYRPHTLHHSSHRLLSDEDFIPSDRSSPDETAGSTLRGPFAPSIPVPLPDRFSSASAPEQWRREEVKGPSISKRSSRPPVFNFADLMDAGAGAGATDMLGSLDLGLPMSPPMGRAATGGGKGTENGRERGRWRREEVVSRG